jgi:hypothetical protein
LRGKFDEGFMEKTIDFSMKRQGEMKFEKEEEVVL